MISNSDFERLWFLYKTEGEPKGVSINAFCLSRGVGYNEFMKWYRKTHHSVVPLEVEGSPEPPSDSPLEPMMNDGQQDSSPKKGGIHVFIRTSDGLQVQKKGLSYQGLVKLVEKLEGLC